MFHVKEGQLQIAPETKVLKAEHYDAFLKANDIIRIAEEKAAKIEEDARIAFEEEKKRGYQQGVDEGNEKMSELMVESAVKSLENFEKFENDVIEIVLKAVRKILGEIDQKEMIDRIVRSGLELVKNQKKINVLVSPNNVGTIKENVDSLLKDFPTVNFIEVHADQRVEDQGCILETDMGVVDASIELQLEAIKNSLTRVIK